MTLQEFYKTGRFVPDYTKYGGHVNNVDFDGYSTLDDSNGFHTLTNIASRIASDERFDRSCMLQAQNRERKKLYKNRKAINDNK